MTAPANDDWTNAQVIVGASGSVVGTTVDATMEVDEDPHVWANDGVGGYVYSDSSVWYRWVAPSDGLLAIQTFSGEALRYPVISVYENPTSVADADARITSRFLYGYSAYQSAMVDVFEGRAYYITVGRPGVPSGSPYLQSDFTMSWFLVDNPASPADRGSPLRINGLKGAKKFEDFSARVTVPYPLRLTDTESNRATGQFGGSKSTPFPSMWFSWRAPRDGRFTITPRTRVRDGWGESGIYPDDSLSVRIMDERPEVGRQVNPDLDFDNGIAGWTANGGLLEHVVAPGPSKRLLNSGSSSARSRGEPGVSFALKLSANTSITKRITSPRWPVTPGKRLIGSAFVRASHVYDSSAPPYGTDVRIRYNFFDGSGALITWRHQYPLGIYLESEWGHYSYSSSFEVFADPDFPPDMTSGDLGTAGGPIVVPPEATDVEVVFEFGVDSSWSSRPAPPDATVWITRLCIWEGGIDEHLLQQNDKYDGFVRNIYNRNGTRSDQPFGSARVAVEVGKTYYIEIYAMRNDYPRDLFVDWSFEEAVGNTPVCVLPAWLGYPMIALAINMQTREVQDWLWGNYSELEAYYVAGKLPDNSIYVHSYGVSFDAADRDVYLNNGVVKYQHGTLLEPRYIGDEPWGNTGSPPGDDPSHPKRVDYLATAGSHVYTYGYHSGVYPHRVSGLWKSDAEGNELQFWEVHSDEGSFLSYVREIGEIFTISPDERYVFSRVLDEFVNPYYSYKFVKYDLVEDAPVASIALSQPFTTESRRHFYSYQANKDGNVVAWTWIGPNTSRDRVVRMHVLGPDLSVLHETGDVQVCPTSINPTTWFYYQYAEFAVDEEDSNYIWFTYDMLRNRTGDPTWNPDPYDNWEQLVHLVKFPLYGSPEEQHDAVHAPYLTFHNPSPTYIGGEVDYMTRPLFMKDIWWRALERGDSTALSQTARVTEESGARSTQQTGVQATVEHGAYVNPGTSSVPISQTVRLTSKGDDL